MKVFGFILTGIGLILSFFTFLFFTLEDYTPYDDPVPIWPMLLGVAMIIIGVVCLKKTQP